MTNDEKQEAFCFQVKSKEEKYREFRKKLIQL